MEGELMCRSWKSEPTLRKYDGNCPAGSDHIDFGIHWNNLNKPKVHHDGATAVRVNETKPPKREEPPIPILVILPNGTVIGQPKPGPVDYDKK